MLATRSPFRPIVFVALCLTLVVWVPAASAQDEELGFFESRSVLASADDRLAAGDFAAAEELYERVVAGVDEGTQRRARALLGAALAELSQPAEERDVDGAREHLREYAASPEAEENVTARVLLGLLGTPDPEPTAPAPPPPRREEPSGPTAADIASLQARIADLEEQLERKNELIEELRKIVVEGDG